MSSLELPLEYNIIFPTIEITGGKSCCIRKQIIGITVVSNVTLAMWAVSEVVSLRKTVGKSVTDYGYVNVTQ